MPKSLSDPDFRPHLHGEMTDMDRLEAFVRNGTDISPELSVKLDRYKRAFAMMSDDKSPAETIRKMQQIESVSYSQACLIVRESIQFFGDVYEHSRQGLKQIMYEKYIRISDRAERAEDFKSAVAALDKACKVLDLYNPNKQGSMQQVFNITINRSTDPKVLEDSQTIDITADE